MKINVTIPKESVFIVEFQQENLPGIATINKKLQDENLRKVFRWNASVIVYFDDLIMNGMPSEKSNQLANKFEDELLKLFSNNERPNGLWQGNITWNGSKEIIFRVFMPEMLDGYLTEKIEKRTYDLKFDYEISYDPNWDEVKWIDKQISIFQK